LNVVFLAALLKVAIFLSSCATPRVCANGPGIDQAWTAERLSLHGAVSGKFDLMLMSWMLVW
jgi:hypothetical protein